MPDIFFQKYKYIIYAAALAVALAGGTLFVNLLLPVDGNNSSPKEVIIKQGDGLNEIAAHLKEQNLIKSSLVFKLFAVTTLRARSLKPGDYALSPAMGTSQIVNRLVQGGRDEVTVVIPEGWSVRDIDALLSSENIIHKGDLIDVASKDKLEGYLFPDTYRFYVGTDLNLVLEKFRENFKAKVGQFIGPGEAARKTLTLASLVEKEVPNSEDRKIVAGILLKRLDAGWPLQVDSTICYIKPGNCYPLSPLDFKIDSPYNTYLYKGLPPTPIANPGIDAIGAALHPTSSPYWFYLSDPKTHKTFFARTLDEQTKNKRLVLP